MRVLTFGRSTPGFVTALVLAAFLGVRTIAAAPAAGGQAQGRFVAKEDILLFGLSLHVECNPNEVPDADGTVVCQTVPKGFATAVPTMFVAPQLPENIPSFGPDAVIKGTLRGPSFPTPIELTALPNTPFSIPAMSVAGNTFARRHPPGQQRRGADARRSESVIIDVIDKLLVTQVTARPLTAAKIREKGIVFDKSNFQAYNFSAAFAIEDTKDPDQLPGRAADAAGGRRPQRRRASCSRRSGRSRVCRACRRSFPTADSCRRRSRT